MKVYYTYLIFDPRPGKNLREIYAGKGQGDRCNCHLKKAGNPLLRAIIAKCRNLGLEPIVKIVETFTVEKEAYDAERILIKKIGRRDLGTGTLCNLTEGGEGGNSFTMSQDAIRRRSETIKRLCREDPDFREKRYRRNSEAMKKLHADPDFKEWTRNWARELGSSQENIEKVKLWHKRPEVKKMFSDMMTERYNDPIFLEKREKVLREKVYDNPEWREAGRQRMIKYNADPEVKRKAAERMAVISKREDVRAKTAATYARKRASGESKWTDERKKRQSEILRNSVAMKNKGNNPLIVKNLSEGGKRGWITRRANVASKNGD